MLISPKYIGVFITLLISVSFSFAQKPKQIELINANSLEFDNSSGVKAKKLIGNVQFKHEEVLMFCDSAYLFDESNSLNAYGHVRINQGDSLQLYGDSLFYDGNTKTAIVKNNIRLNNNDVNLTTNFLEYKREENLAYFIGGGTMYNKKEKTNLTSQQGYYNSTSKSFFFKKDVVLTHPEYKMKSDTLQYNSFSRVVYFHGPTTINLNDGTEIKCEGGYYNSITDQSKYYTKAEINSKQNMLKADTILYNKNGGIGIATCNVELIDTSENIIVTGDLAHIFDAKDSLMVTDNAIIIKEFEKDTLYMHADTFKVSADTAGNKILYGYNHVKFFKPDMQGKCDSIYYAFADSTIQFFNEPILWNNENQLTGEKMDLVLKNDEIHKLFIDKNAFIISYVDSAKYNQIKGKTIEGYFLENALHNVDVTGNGQTIYYVQDDQKRYIGINKAESSNLRIYLSDNEIKKITFIKDPEGKLMPLNDVSEEELLLKGFIWKIEEKPLTRFDILN